jgi:hypothetical protein
MATYDLGTIGLTVQNTGAQQATQEVQKLGAAAQKVMDDFKRMQAVLALAKKGTDDAAASFRRLSVTELQQASKQMRGFEAALANTRRGMGQMGVATQQIGYQVGDFLVQIQSGTNFMVAFGQQATQLVGILPAFSKQLGMSVGSLIGISSVLGIVIPLVTAIGAAFMRTSEGANSGSESVNTYAEALKNLTSEIERNQTAFLKAKFGTGSDAEASALQQELTLRGQIAASQQRILDIEASLDSFRSGRGVAYINLALSNKKEELALEEENLSALEESLAKLEAQAEAQQMLNGHLSAAAGTQARLADEKMRELQAAKDLETATINAHQAYAATRMEANQTAEQVALIESGMSQAAVDALRFAGVDLSSGISAAAREAAILAGNMGIALSQAISIKNMRESEVYSGRGGDPRDFMQGGSKSYSEGFRPFVADTARSGGAARIKKETEAVKELTEAEKQRLNILKSVEGSLESGFMSMIDGTKSVKDAFKSMAADIVKELYRVLVVQRLVGAISGGIGMFSGPSTGSLGLPFGRAAGGPVIANQPYMVGERGPELIIPRSSGMVLNSNKTKAAIGGSNDVTVNNNISVTGSDAAMVRAEVAKMIPQITNATKAAVIDARLRGGQMKQAFR